MGIDKAQRGLLIAGAGLFLIGLLQGAAVSAFTNPRMALSAHLTAVQCGMAIMLAGLVWPAVAISSGMKAFARWCIAGGMIGLWAGLTLSAASGASKSLPIAGAGYRSSPVIETVVSATVGVTSVAMTIGWAILLLGLIRHGSEGR